MLAQGVTLTTGTHIHTTDIITHIHTTDTATHIHITDIITHIHTTDTATHIHITDTGMATITEAIMAVTGDASHDAAGGGGINRSAPTTF
jgi:hypothetical protein